MKLIIIRHGDPDYEHDTLTKKGWREAEYLSDFLKTKDISAFYVSPLGRAKDTASATLKKMGRTATECKWLREFEAPMTKPNLPDEKSIPWDWLPQDWTKEDKYFSDNMWHTTDAMEADQVYTQYKWVCNGLDEVLEKHGYKRKDKIYDAISPNHDTIVFFCHFGLECVLLSHLLNISPMQLWHGCAAAPTSFTTLVTEERRKGIASWRMLAFGERAHLYANNEEPSFSARFSECYSDEFGRLD